MMVRKQLRPTFRGSGLHPGSGVAVTRLCSSLAKLTSIRREAAWSDMDAETQALWQELGWSAVSWAGPRDDCPVTELLDWDELANKERAAASALGFHRDSWDRSCRGGEVCCRSLPPSSTGEVLPGGARSGDAAHILRRARWSDMDDVTQRLWMKLGWNSRNWGTGVGVPTESLDWNELTQQQARVAQLLGYAKSSWDGEDRSGGSASGSGGWSRTDWAILATVLAAVVALLAWDEYQWHRAGVTAAERKRLKAWMLETSAHALHPSWKRERAARVRAEAVSEMLSELRKTFLKLSRGAPVLTREAWLQHCARSSDRDVSAAWFAAIADVHGATDFAGFVSLAVLLGCLAAGDTTGVALLLWLLVPRARPSAVSLDELEAFFVETAPALGMEPRLPAVGSELDADEFRHLSTRLPFTPARELHATLSPIETLFRKADVSGTGTLDLDEFKTHVGACGAVFFVPFLFFLSPLFFVFSFAGVWEGRVLCGCACACGGPVWWCTSQHCCAPHLVCRLYSSSACPTVASRGRSKGASTASAQVCRKVALGSCRVPGHLP